jgi:hypothetical protein
LQRSHWRGSDLRMLPALALVVVSLCGLPAVWNSQWMWIDDQVVVGGQLWPPESVLNQSYHTMGREYIAHGLYFKLLSFVFPLQPFWYYFTNYVLHVFVIGLATRIVWQATRSRAATVLCTLTAGFASTGPEVFLTLLKDELQMTLWLLVALLLVQVLMQTERFRYTGTLVALAAATFLSGMLGKENFVILPTGLAGGLACVALTTRRLKLPGRLFAAVLSTFIGAAAVFVERYLVGTYSIADGGYTGSLFVFHPTLAASLERARLYEFQAGDVMALVVIATLACGGSIVTAALRKRDLTPAQIVALACAVAAAAQVLFNLVFLSCVQVYYLYPAAILATIAFACLWPAGSSQTGVGSGAPRGIRFCRAGLSAVLLGTLILTLPTFAVRLYAQNAVQTLDWRLITAIGAVPPHSLVLLGFPPDAEMIGNARMLLERVLGRSDITVGSAFDPGNAAQLSKAYTERWPVFLAFVHSPGSNSKIGGRGIAQRSRAEILALAAANGIDRVCPDLRETLEPWEITATRVHFKLPPIVTIRFGYGWELDRLLPPYPDVSGCGSAVSMETGDAPSK